MPVSMASIHEAAVKSINADAARLRSQCSGVVPARIEDDAGMFRFLEICDRNRRARRDWLGRFLSWSQEYQHLIGATQFLSQAEQSFSLLVVSGDDLRRVAKIVAEVHKAYPQKIVVPVLGSCLPADRATLLNRGADDVLHTSMNDREAAGRIYALFRRHEWVAHRSQDAATRARQVMAAIRPVTKGHLSPRERQILCILLSRASGSSSYRTLARATGHRGESGGLKSLRVTISLLRKKLVGGLQITSVRGEGYALSYGKTSLPEKDKS